MKNPYLRRNSSLVTSIPVETSPLDAYLQFLDKICHQAKVFSLYKDGWSVSATESGTYALSIWQSESLARVMQQGKWAEFEVREIAFLEFIEQTLPFLRKQRMVLMLDLNLEGKYISADAIKLLSDLKKYLYLLSRKEPHLFFERILPLPRLVRIHH